MLSLLYGPTLTSICDFWKSHWRRKWQPTPVFLPGKSLGWRNLAGYSLWRCRVRHDWVTSSPSFLSWLYRTLSAKWCLCFLICCLSWSQLLLKEQGSFIFMAIVTVHSDFGAQENKICHCFQFFPIYLPWSDGTRCHEFFECWGLSQLFHSPLPRSSRGSSVPLHFLPLEWNRLHI